MMSLSPLMSDYWDSSCGPLSLFDGALPSLDNCALLKSESDTISSFQQAASNQSFYGSTLPDYTDNHAINIFDEFASLENETTAEDLLKSLSNDQNFDVITNISSELSHETLVGQHIAENTLQLKDQIVNIPDYLIDSTLSTCVDLIDATSSRDDAPNPFISEASEIKSPRNATTQDIMDCFHIDSDLEVNNFDLNLLSLDTLQNVIPGEPLPEVSVESLDGVLSSASSPAQTPVADSSSTTVCSELENLLLAPQPSAFTNMNVDAFNVEPFYKVKKGRKRTSEIVAPYSKPKKCGQSIDKKERKKQQNKEAATRYREKKRQEGEEANQEFYVLEKHNKELKDKVDSISREISYLKNLLSDVKKAQMSRS